MNVHYVTIGFPVGSERFVMNDIHALRRRGHGITVHALRPRPGDAEPLLSEEGLTELAVTHTTPGGVAAGLAAMLGRPGLALWLVKQVLAACRRRPRHLWHSLALLPRAFELLGLIEREDPDIVHLVWGHYPSLVGLLVNRKLPHIVVSQMLGSYDLAMRYGCGERLARRADTLWTYARVNVAALAALGVPPDRVAVNYHGVDPEKLANPVPPKLSGRTIAVGRLIEGKGMAEVLKTFRDVLRTVPDATLLILGDGPRRRALESLCRDLGISDAVEFGGFVTHRQVLHAMAEAEASILMSHWYGECLPNVVKEAMLSSCVPVVSHTPGIEELVEDGVTGFIVRQGDIAGAARALVRILNDEKVRDAMARRARSAILERFNADRTMEAYLAGWAAAKDAKAGPLESRHGRTPNAPV